MCKAGWEDTVAGYGRPQHIINQEVDRCDLFIGMIWKRWGTPPSRDGKFTSGFQEEFERAIERREGSGSPEISLYLRKLSRDDMEDPGEGLKKVMEFREKIIADKKILYQEFSEPQDMEKLGRKCITAYVQKVSAADESSEPSETRVKRTEPESEKMGVEKGSPESSPLSAEGFTFLKNLVDRIGQEEAMKGISASDVARFRLLANSISKPGNEKMNLGVHDLNILFSARSAGMKLGARETRCLAKLGFQHLNNEVVPLWCWYSDLSDSRLDVALISAWLGANDDETVGAIRVLRTLALQLPTGDNIRREWFVNRWFSENSSARVRSAALAYLTKNGTAEDYHVAKKEYDRSDHWTSRQAFECMIGILLRTGRETSAQQLVLESQFESLDSDTLQAVLDGFENLETGALPLGLEHRNVQIRLQTLKVLVERGALNREMAERLSNDGDAVVRNEVVTTLEKFNGPLTEEEVKKILVRPQKQPSLGLPEGRLADSDWKGEELFEQYQLERLKKCSESVLTKKVESSLMYDDSAYFARAERYFAKYAEDLRRNIDNTFSAYYEEMIRREEAFFGNTFRDRLVRLVRRHRNLEDHTRKSLTRQGLNILCRAGKREDLQRVRGNLQSGYAGTSKADVEYLGKHGGWEDISLVANVDTPYFAEGPLGGNGDFRDQVAKTILTIGRGHSISMLFTLDIPAIILKKTIELCAEARFTKISDDALLGLLDHESADVRKAASIKAVRAFSTRRIKAILNKYIGSDKYRYYNVIHWLDLGASMPRNEARKIARAATG